MGEFIDVYVKRTGKKQRVPAHWMKHPTLSKPFSKTPRSKASDKAPLATPVTDDAPASPENPSTTETPAAGAKE